MSKALPTSFCSATGCTELTPNVFCERHAKPAGRSVYSPRRRVPIECVETGAIYGSAFEAASNFGVTANTITRAAFRGSANKTGLTFRYAKLKIKGDSE